MASNAANTTTKPGVLDSNLAELRDMRAFAAGDFQKPALDWAIRRLAAAPALVECADRVATTLQMPTLVKQSGKNENAGFIDMRDWYALQGEVKELRAAIAAMRGAA